MITRRLVASDAPAIAALWRANREHLDPWSPDRPAAFYTDDGQREVVARKVARSEAGLSHARVVLDGDEVVGEITLDDVVRGAFESAHLGYWLAAPATGRGLATRSVLEVVEHAFGPMRLHRVQAATLVHNEASQAVLERVGFTPIGRAPQYLRIAGRWQDHLLFQLLAPQEAQAARPATPIT